MWKLTIEDDEGQQTSLPLAHDDYGVGRSEENAIRLTDRNVSRKHASLVRNGQGWAIKDHSSYNGTYVNGLRVAGEQPVVHGDIVQLGDYRLELVDEAADKPVAPGHVPVHQRPDRLVVVVGPNPGAEFPLDREYLTVGRAEDANISINHTSVSRFHAELISLGNSRYEIIDKNSANGIRINGAELKRGFLEPGDAVELGDVRLRFVARGKIFRAGADQSQQLRAVSTFESVAPSVRAPAMGKAPAKSGGVGKYIGLGALLGLIAIAVLIFLMRSPTEVQTSPEPAASTGSQPEEDPGALQLLDEAVALREAGDLEAAHRKALQIPEGSPVRKDPRFLAVEAAWADSMFAKAALTEDRLEKRRILNEIAITSSVDMERRNRAIEEMREIEKSSPEPLPPLPTTPTYIPPPPPPTSIYDDKDKTPPKTESSTDTDGGKDEDWKELGKDPSQYQKLKDELMAKAASGTASKEQLLALRGVCLQLNDKSCLSFVVQQLKQHEQ